MHVDDSGLCKTLVTVEVQDPAISNHATTFDLQVMVLLLVLAAGPLHGKPGVNQQRRFVRHVACSWGHRGGRRLLDLMRQLYCLVA